MEKMNTAAIYARFSSNNQREESIDAQLRICHKFAHDNGLKVVKEYTDSAISGRTDQRPAFQRMIQDSAKGEFDVLLIYAHDRFSRNKYDTAIYKNRLKRNGVRIISATLPLDDSPEAGLMEGIMENFAQYYSENLSRSTKRGLEENALRCKSNGSPPLGYKAENGYFVVDPVGAKAVQLIFEMYAKGYGKTEISQTLNEAGYKSSRGHKFSRNGLHSILANERYTGVYIYDGHRVEGGLPAIIDRELFDKVQQQIERNRKGRGRFKAMEEYLLSGKVFCGSCGKPMIGDSGTSSTGAKYQYYTCTARKHDSKACSKKSVRKEWLEDKVIEYICHEVLTDEMIDELAEREFALLSEEAADMSLVTAMQAEYDEVSEKIENMLEAIENGLYTAKTKERLLALENRQSELEDKIVREKLKKPEFTKDHIVFWLMQFRQGNIEDFDYRKALVNTLVNSVHVYDGDNKKSNDNRARIVIAINITNRPVKALESSDVYALGHQLEQDTNFQLAKKYLAVFMFMPNYV